jgi:hypothetical protein
MSTGTNISLTLYDPKTGTKIKSCKSLNFNKANVGEFTTPVVIRMFVNGAIKIENVRIGIVDSTETISGSGTANADGSVSAGNAGIEHSKTFIEKASLTRYFEGANETGISTGGKLVSVENLTANSTEYIYLNTKVGDEVGDGYVKYKWFFDMA